MYCFKIIRATAAGLDAADAKGYYCCSMATILIVDDSLFMRMSLKAIIEEAGHVVVGMAADGKEAIELHNKLKPNLITLDVNMMGMDGLAALEILMRDRPRPNVLMISADKQKATAEHALALGATGFINKPFNPKEIALTIKRVCPQAA